MIPSSKVLWGEGLFLRPQHFQRQDAYHEWRLVESLRGVHPYAWGVRRLRVDSDALQSGVLRVTELAVVFPDGELYTAPAEDDLPDAVSLAGLPSLQGDVVCHLAIAPLKPNGSNFQPAADGSTGGAGGDAGRRYAQRDEPASDWFTQAAAADVTLLKRSARLLPDGEPRDHLVSLPVLRLRRLATGGFELDTRFIAPSLTVQACAPIGALLRRLLEMLQAKVDALYGFHREPSRHVIEFRSGDIASFWLLHTCSAACAALSHYQQHPGLHPERLYERLLELAGALLTFSKTFTLADLPAYRHAEPGPAFERLDHIVRELLEAVISTRYFSVAITESKPSFHIGRLDSDKIDATSSFFLGVSASLPPSELVDAVPLRLKVGAPDDVDKFVLSALPGVRLTHAPQVPAAIPVRPGTYYFSLDARGPLYERMLQAKSITIYVPSGLDDVQLELFALTG